jgi:hypothetical protein
MAGMMNMLGTAEGVSGAAKQLNPGSSGGGGGMMSGLGSMIEQPPQQQQPQQVPFTDMPATPPQEPPPTTSWFGDMAHSAVQAQNQPHSQSYEDTMARLNARMQEQMMQNQQDMQRPWWQQNV